MSAHLKRNNFSSPKSCTYIIWKIPFGNPRRKTIAPFPSYCMITVVITLQSLLYRTSKFSITYKLKQHYRAKMTLRYKHQFPTVRETSNSAHLRQESRLEPVLPGKETGKTPPLSLLAPGLGHAPTSGRNHINTGEAPQSGSRFHTVHFM